MAVGLGAVAVAVLVVALVAMVVGAVVVGAVGVEVGDGLDVVVAVGVVAASAVSCEGPNEVKARAIEAARAIETAGNATTARRRMRRTGPLFMRFTGNSLGLLVLGKNIGWSGKPGHPMSDMRESMWPVSP